jgi:high-affinity nickel-transport protein
MNLAYGWAICFFIGGIELLSLLPHEIKGLVQTSGFWGWMYHFNLNTAGFVIVGMFVLTWLVALLIWRLGRIEDKWSAGS